MWQISGVVFIYVQYQRQLDHGRSMMIGNMIGNLINDQITSDHCGSWQIDSRQMPGDRGSLIRYDLIDRA